MRRKRVMIAVVITALLLSVFAVNTADVNAAANSSTYKIKVNTQTNVVTVYKKYGTQYKPYRSMVCSSGGKKTPLGTFKLKYKIRWCKLVGNVWGQYCSVINGDYLFHSVPYKAKAKNTVIGREYNKLGTSCSHGCIRLSAMDAKWIYSNCPSGTKVTLFRSKSKGPLGKPVPIKVANRNIWDPTDPDSKNPNFRMKAPQITISSKKPALVQYGDAYSLKKYVTAKNVNAYQNLTHLLKVSSVKKYKNGKWVTAKFSTKSLGTYKITYSAYSIYCKKTGYKSFKVRVADTLKPVITAADRTVTAGDVNAVSGMTAKQRTRNRTATVTVYIKAPDSDTFEEYTYSAAEAYIFEKEGIYNVMYKVKNYYSPYIEAVKSIKITCEQPE